jgi:hypothetical protein
MTEGNIPIENSPEQNDLYWAKAKLLLDDDDPSMKNRGMTHLLIRMAPKLLEENYDIYREGFDLTIQALALEDNDVCSYYTTRYCAICILANVLEQIQEDPKVEYSSIYAEAALAIEDKANDKQEHKIVRVLAKDAVRKYLKGERKRIFR